MLGGAGVAPELGADVPRVAVGDVVSTVVGGSNFFLDVGGGIAPEVGGSVSSICMGVGHGCGLGYRRRWGDHGGEWGTGLLLTYGQRFHLKWGPAFHRSSWAWR